MGKITYKIFLASSNELEQDRIAFADTILALNQSLALQNREVEFKLYKWEYDTVSFAEMRKQSEYNKNITNCDIFVMLYWSKVGKYTEEEYDFAYKNLQGSKKGLPVVYVFQKIGSLPELQSNEEKQSLIDFNTKIDSRDGQFRETYTSFKDFEVTFEREIYKLFAKKILDDRKLPYNRTFGNFEYILKTAELDKAKTVLDGNGHKILCVHGVSGSGKTKFVENLLYDITDNENVVWIDCAESNPTPIEIANKLSNLIAFDSISDKRKTLLIERLSNDKSDENQKKQILKDDLADQVQSLTSTDIVDWFPKDYLKKRYVVLDDFDNLVDKDGNRSHWLANNFLEKCLEWDSAPCIIIIFKYPETEIGKDKTCRYLLNDANEAKYKNLKTLIDFDENSINLRNFGRGETLEYIERTENLIGKEFLYKLVDIKADWMPIQLQLLTGEFKVPQSDSKKSELEQFILSYKSDIALIDFLSRQLFKRVVSESQILIKTAGACAILQKYNSGHRAIDKQALLFIFEGDCNLKEIEQNLSSLEKKYSILKKFINLKSNLPENREYSFQHDTKLGYAYDGLVKDKFLTQENRRHFHVLAAEYYKNKFNQEKFDESVKSKYGQFAVWNYSQISDNWKDRMKQALPILNKIDRELRTSFNYIDLDELRRALINLGSDKLQIQLNKDFIDEQASNVADLAEVYYQGLDKWTDAKKMTLNVINSFNGKGETLEAFVQATNLAAILNFETELNTKLFLKTFNKGGEYKDIKLKGKDKLYCIRLLELLLNQSFSIDVKVDVYNKEYTEDEINNKTHGLQNKSIIANLCNSLGVFLNRAEKYSDAIAVYKFSISILKSISNQIQNSLSGKLNICTQKYELASDNKEKKFWKEQETYLINLANKWDEYIDKDLMCVHSNLSRTLLLSRGIDDAIEYFGENLKEWFGKGETKPKKINPNHSYSSSQEYNYALMNISYYHFCKGNILEANQWWNKSQDIPGEEWLKLTKQQMKLVLRAYTFNQNSSNDKSSLYSEFKKNSDDFKGIDGRAVLFSDFNLTSLKIAETLNSIKAKLSISEIKKESILNEYTKKIFEIFEELKKQRIRADDKDYYLAAKVITYTHNELLKKIKRVEYGVGIDIGEIESHSNWKSNWEEDVTKHLNDIMTRDSNEISFQPWRPPMLMAGILLMRSKPFAPSDDEITEIMNETIIEYDSNKA